MKIILTGATGLVGQELGIALVRQGYELLCLVREKNVLQKHAPFLRSLWNGMAGKLFQTALMPQTQQPSSTSWASPLPKNAGAPSSSRPCGIPALALPNNLLLLQKNTKFNILSRPRPLAFMATAEKKSWMKAQAKAVAF